MNVLLAQTPSMSAFLFSFFGIWTCYLIPDSAASPKGKLVVLTLLLTSYLALEIKRLKDSNPDRWLLNPAVLCSLVTFFMSFCIGNILFLVPEEKVALVGLLPDVTPSILKLMLLVLLAAIAMWMGYWSSFAESMANRLRMSTFLQRVIQNSLEPKPSAIAICLILCLLSRLISIKLGIYGYSSDPQRLIETASFRQYLTMLELLGKLALLLVALQYFNPNSINKNRNMLVGIVIFEIFFGFVSGFKSAVGMPLVIVGICYYIMLNKIPWRIIMMIPVAIFAAYVVIEPFRMARYSDDDFRGTDLNSIVTTIVKASYLDRDSYSTAEEEESAGTGLAFLARTSYTQVASNGIEFADNNPLPEGSPEFLKDIFLAPLYAIVPRFLWGTKETTRHGSWYNIEVMGAPETSNTAVGMSPFGYLYFAGGTIMVIAGFYFIGILQRALVALFSVTDASLLIYLSIFSSLVLIDSVYYSLIVEIIRMFILSIIIQYIVIAPPFTKREN